jgi:RNA polymerase sigma-70 factor (ECF subfamily)
MAGDPFEKEILENVTRLRNFARRQVNSAADADDLAQETLFKALRSRDSLHDKTCLQAWQYRIARRAIIDHYRRDHTGERLTSRITQSTQSEADVVTEAVACAALGYLGTLPEQYRMAVRMADYEGLPHAEIARRLGISLAAAKSRVRRAKQRIRQLWRTVA